MQNLPTELISRIFVESWPASQFVRPDTCSPPLQLTGVCSQWREIALCTPLLWSSLDTTPKPGTSLRRIDPADKTRYKEWLSRSGNFNISLSVAFEEDENQFWMEDWMHFVSSYGSRFGRLRVVDGCGVDWDELLWGADNLEYLYFQSRSTSHATMKSDNTFPRLKTLVLDQVVVDHSKLRSAQWSNTTHLTVKLPDGQNCPMDDFAEVLCYFPNLQAIVYGRITLGSAQEIRRLTLYNLRSVTLVMSNFIVQGQSLLMPEGSLGAQKPVLLPSLYCLRVQRDFPLDLEDALCKETSDDLAGAERRCRVFMESHQAFRIFDAGWERLAHLELKFEGKVYALNTVLVLCHHLQTLHLTGRHCDTRSTSLLGDLLHWELTEMYINVDAEIGDLFRTATFPLLRVLCIDAVWCGHRRDILSMLGRSGALLDRIQLKESCSSAGWTKRTRDELATLLGPSTIVVVDLLHNEDADWDSDVDEDVDEGL